MSSESSLRCVILGGGGHARVVIDALRLSGTAEPFAMLDNDRALWGREIVGIRVLGGDELLPQLRQQGVGRFVVGLGGIGDNEPRRRLFELGVRHGLTALTVVHPSAACSPWARVGAGSVLLPLCVVNTGAALGVNVIVNTAAVVEHDCQIGDHVHVATGARLAGAVTVGSGAHIGAGATVRQQVVVGERSVVGAGAVVLEDVPPRTVVAGVPARPLPEHSLVS